MSGFMPADSRIASLNNLAASAKYVGLAVAIPENTNDVTLANITEVTTGGYARASVAWNPAAVAAGGTYGVDPVQLSNSGDVNWPAVTEDMVPAPYAFATDTASGNSIATPVISTPLAAAGTGGTFAAGTYYWVVTALNAKGETVASNEVSATLLANAEQVLSWTAIAGATSYNVYRGTVSGDEGILVANTTGTSYTDTGAAGTAQTPPAAGTAAVGKVLYVWELAEPVAALSGKPILAPAGDLIIE